MKPPIRIIMSDVTRRVNVRMMAAYSPCSLPGSGPADPEGGCACTPEEVEENMEQQRTELEMLQSIYSSEITVVKENTEFLVCFPRLCNLIPVIIRMYFHSR